MNLQAIKTYQKEVIETNFLNTQNKNEKNKPISQMKLCFQWLSSSTPQWAYKNNILLFNATQSPEFFLPSIYNNSSIREIFFYTSKIKHGNFFLY